MKPVSTLGSKGRSLVRFFKLLALLLEGPKTRQELMVRLMEELVHVDQGEALPALRSGKDPIGMLDRDIAMIKRLGILEFSPGRRYQVRPTHELPLWLEPHEVQAIDLASRAIEQLGIPEARALEELIARVPAVIRRATRHHAVTLTPSLREIDPGVWEQLQDAIARGRRLSIRYQRPHDSEPRWRDLDRARLIWLTGAFYLCAYSPEHAAAGPDLPPYAHLREFRLDRIHEVAVSDEPVKLTELPTLRYAFLLDAELHGRLETLCDSEGRIVQQVERLPGGVLRIQNRDFSLLRARQRVLSFGAHLIAVEDPPELQQEVERMIQILAKRFPGNPHGATSST